MKKTKEHTTVHSNTAMMKGPGLSKLKFRLRNFCFLGAMVAFLMALLSRTYVQVSFRSAVDEAKSLPSQLIFKVDIDYDAANASLQDGPHSSELSDSKGSLQDDDDAPNSADVNVEEEEVEIGNHKRKSSDVVAEQEEEVIEKNSFAAGHDQKLVAAAIEDVGEEGSIAGEAETVLRQKTSDEDDTQLLEDGASQVTESSSVSNSTKQDRCDIFKGHWIPDPLGPLYSYNSCRVLSQPQNCQDNGRPDKQYEFYKWKPHGCEIPRFDPTAFLKFMQGKTLAFVGDSLARNQYESLLCILMQVAHANPRGNRNMQRWNFPAYKLSLIRVWSTFLVRHSSESFSYAPEDTTKIFLDELDDYAKYMPSFDVMVISSGHWWMKKSAYIVGGKIQGGYKWEPNVTSKKIDQGKAFSLAFENVLKLVPEVPNYKGLTILKTYSPDHYSGGHWDTGGSCTGKTKPYAPNEVPENAFNEMMRAKQVDALRLAMQNDPKRRSSYALLDVFESLNYRADGHPGPYRSRDPNKRTQRDEKGRPPPQDCLHWCMPGPVDSSNQLLFELLKRELPEQRVSK